MSLPYQQIEKTVLVGPSGAGKSELLKKLTKNGINYKEDGPLTIGVEFDGIIIEHDTHKTKLQVWDTSGQKKYELLMKAYYQKTVVFLLCFDYSNPESINQLDNFISNIHSHGPENAGIILVGTKHDIFEESSHREPSEEEINRLVAEFIERQKEAGANIILAEPTSAKKDKGFDELRSTIGNSLTQMMAQSNEDGQSKTNFIMPHEFGNSHYEPAPQRNSFFNPTTKQKMCGSYGLGVAASAGEVVLTGLLLSGVLSMSLGIGIGVLALVAVTAICYAGYQAFKPNEPERGFAYSSIN